MPNKQLEDRLIFFDEQLHKYTDQFGNVYTSTTTLIDKYCTKFDNVTKAKACAGKGQYYGMSWKQVLKIWEKTRRDASAHGNKEHNYLEESIKDSTNYSKISNNYKGSRIYTIDDVIVNNSIGELDDEKLSSLGLEEDRVKIYNFLTKASASGYKIYSEVGVYIPEYLVSGLVDCPIINFEKKNFIIVDWKTNKRNLIPFNDEKYKWKSGYFKKDNNGKDTDKFVETMEYLKAPLDHLQQSNYVKYSLQLSLYAYQMELRGLTCSGLVLFHISHDKYQIGDVEVMEDINMIGKNKVEHHVMPYMKNEIIDMLNHHNSGLVKNGQLEMFK